MKRHSMLTSMMMYLALHGYDGVSDHPKASKERRIYEPWSGIHLSKAERRGKSYQEIQAARKAKWEAMQ